MKAFRVSLLVVACVLTVPALSAAQTTSDSAIAGLLSKEMPRLLDHFDVPGGVLAVVRRDRVLLNAGYGLADRARRVPVSSDSALFRIASVAKLFVALAALKLEEAGQLRLDDDLRPLLPDFDLGEETLTMKQLLTHSAGFDERMIGYLSSDTSDSRDLASVLRERQPNRLNRPSWLPSYSNYSFALAGLVIERVSGQPYHQYLRRTVLQPLGLSSTGIMIPPLPAMADRLVAEYRSNGEKRAFTFSPAYPAGNIATTGADMTLFLRALLGSDSAVVSARVRARLFSPALQYHERMPPLGLGNAAQRVGAYTVWQKGGSSRSHAAVIAVYPELDLAVFVAVNRQEPQVWNALLQLLGDSIAAWSPQKAADLPDTVAQVPVSGVFRWTRAPETSIERVIGLAAQVRVHAENGGLAVSGLQLDGQWLALPSGLYRRSDGKELGLRRSPDGTVTHIASQIEGEPIVLERIPFYETLRFQLGAVLFGSLATLAAGIAAARRSRGGRRIEIWERVALIGLPVAQVAAIVAAVFLARDADALALGPTPWLYTTATLTTVTALVGCAQVVAASRLSVASNIGPGARVAFGAGALGAVALIAFLAGNSLIGFQF